MSDLPALSQGVLRHATPSRNRYATVPGTTVRLLTQTSKMPGPSFSLPAHRSCPRANGTICDNCYASKGCYSWRSTQNAQEARFHYVIQSMRTPEGKQSFVAFMIAAIRATKTEYFRVHDSGDMFN